MPVAKLTFSINNEHYTIEFAELEGEVKITDEYKEPEKGVLTPIEDLFETTAEIRLVGKLLPTSTIPCGTRMFVNPKGSEVRLIK